MNSPGTAFSLHGIPSPSRIKHVTDMLVNNKAVLEVDVHGSIQTDDIDESNAILECTLDALKDATQLQKLDIGDTWILHDYVDRFSAVLTGLTGLRVLNISETRIAESKTDNIANALKMLTRLEVLDISCNYIGADKIKSIIGALSGLTEIRVLNVSCNYMENANASAVASALANMPRLEVLDISSNMIGVSGIGEILQSLKTPTLLHSLKVFNTFIKRVQNVDDGDIAAFAAGLKRLSRLQTLNIKSNQINGNRMKLVADALAALAGTLTALDISYNEISYDDVVILVDALKTLTKLQTFDITGNSFGDNGATYIADNALVKLTELRALYIGMNGFTATGTISIFNVLPTLSRLEIVDTSKNSMRQEGAVAIAKNLSRLHQLQTLDVSENQLKYTGAAAVAFAVSGLTKMRTLNMTDNFIGDKSKEKFLLLFFNLLKLHTVNIRHNGIPAQKLSVILSSLFATPSLKLICHAWLIDHEIEPVFVLRRKIFASGIPQAVGAFSGANLELQIELLDAIYRRQAGLGNTLLGQAAGDANPLKRERTRFTVCCDCGVALV